MQLLKRSALWVFVVGGFLFGGLCPAEAQTQDDAPFAYLAVSSVDKLKQDLGYVLEMADQKQLLHLGEFFVGQAGLETTRPFLVSVHPGAQLPSIRVFVPTADRKKLFATLAAHLPEQKQLEEDLFQLSGPQRVFARTSGPYTVFSLDRESLAGELTIPRGADNLVKEFNVGFSVGFQKIPQQYRQMLLSTVDDRDARNVMQTLLSEGKSFSYGFGISKEKRQFVFDSEFVAVEGSKLGEMLSGFDLKSPLNNLLTTGNPFNVGVNLRLPKPLVELLKDGWRQEVAGNLPNVPAGERNVEQTLLLAANDLVNSNLNRGKLHFVASAVAPKDRPMTLYGAIKLSGVETFFGKIEDVIEKAGPGELPKEFTLNAASYRGLSLHAFETPIADPEAKQVFGENVTLHFTAADDTLFWSFGESSEGVLKKVVEVALDPKREPSSLPAVFAQFRAGAWTRFFPTSESDDPIQVAAKEVLRDQDRMTLGVSLLARGISTRLILEEDYLRLLAIAFRQGYEESMNASARVGN